MRRPTWLQIIASFALVALTLCVTAVAWAAHVSDLPPALQLNPAQVLTVEAKINNIRTSLGHPARTPDARLQAAAASCYTRADSCMDANAWLGLLAAHGYPMGAASVALGFGVSEDAVLAHWLSDPVYGHRVFKQGGSSVYLQQGCAVLGIGYGVNVVCFLASEFEPFEVLPTGTPAPLVRPAMPTSRPLVTATATPRPFPSPTRRW